MNKKSILLGTVAYVAATFPLAIIWHIVLFKPLYLSFGYFGEHPNFPLGFLSMLIQGFILSYGFSIVKITGSSAIRGFKYAAFMGIFFWTCHVIAAAAKNSQSDTALFFVMETLYLSFQFGIYGFLIGKIFKNTSTQQ